MNRDSTGETYEEPWHRTAARGPVVQTLAAMLLASVVTWIGGAVGVIDPFVLGAPVFDPPWALAVSVYAHAGPGHLLANALLVAVAGTIVGRGCSTPRFHLFFLGTGMLAGVSEVWVGLATGAPAGVLGSSGAAFALVGYVLAANPASGVVLRRLSGRAAVVLVAAVALVLTVVASAPGSAFVAHFTGGVLGLGAGRFRLLHRA